LFNFCQYSNNATETIQSKRRLESLAKQEGIKIHKFHADNGIFASKKIKDDCALMGQIYSFSGVGAHHQNGVAERNVKTLAQWACANMLHLAHHWPSQTNVRFWPQAIEYSIWVFNRLPHQTIGLSPNKLWLSCRALTEEINRAHVFGCPVYVLDAALQDGHKIPRWSPRARLGIFLGFSTLHSLLVPLVMNVVMGKISPQFHVIFDHKFETVVSANSTMLMNEQWRNIFWLGRECYGDVDYDATGRPILPPLTLIFTPNEIMHEHTPLSPWVSGDKGNNMYPDLDPEAVPREDDNQSVTNTEGDMSSEGEMLSQPILVPASNMPQTSVENDTYLPLIPPASPDTNIGNSQSPAPTRPRQNVGTYKQGPAQI
jgi:hypothetical protein